MKNSFDINDYHLIQDIDNNKKDWLFVTVIFLVTVGIFIVLGNFNFKVYEKHNLVKEDDKFLLIIDSKELNFLESNKYIYINEERYEYDILKIDSNYSSINDIIYQTVYINPYNYKTNAIITECYILKNEGTIYDVIVDFIKGGFG